MPAVAIFPWGDVIEDFLDPIGLTVADFVERMSGGWLFGYVAALQASGWRAVVVCVSKSATTARRCRHASTGASIWLVPGRPTPPTARPSRHALRQWAGAPLRAFGNVLRSEGCEYVLAQEYEYARFDILALLCTWRRLHLFATFQGGDATLSPLESKVRPWSLHRSRGLIIASGKERARVAARYPTLAVPISSIPNPLDTQEWRALPREQARAELGLPGDAFLVVSHGRIDIQRKGLDILLDVWGRFVRSRPDSRLHLLGAGQDDKPFAAMLADANLPSISWDARYTTDRLQVRRWLSAADAYIITSRTEGMPVAPIEAMSCGLPVVASRAHGLPDIFPNGEASGGLLFDSGDSAAAAAALSRLANDAAYRRALSQAGRATIESRFSVAAVGRDLTDFMSQASVKVAS
jgi:starch synthase